MGNTLTDENTATQCRRIRAYLETGATLTPIDALNMFGCFRLGARIWDLRHKQGLDIVSRPVAVAGGRKRVAGYYMAGKEAGDVG